MTGPALNSWEVGPSEEIFNIQKNRKLSHHWVDDKDYATIFCEKNVHIIILCIYDIHGTCFDVHIMYKYL